MQEVAEKEVYVVLGEGEEKNKSLVFVRLPKEKISQLGNLGELIRKNEAWYINHKIRDLELTAYSKGKIGYFSPDEVKSYFCAKCNEEYQEKPKQDVFIELPGHRIYENHIGVFHLKCNHCDEWILTYGLVKDKDVVDPKFIVKDDRGLFIPKTKEDVDKELEKLLGEAKKGPCLIRDEVVIYWANNLGIDISVKLKEIEQIREEAYFKDYQERIPEVIKELERHSEFAGRGDQFLRKEHNESLTYEEGSGFFEIWGEFLKYLPKLSFTPELKEKTLQIIKTIKGNAISHKKTIREYIEEKTKEANEAINEKDKEINDYKLLEDLVKQK
mgnify:CR=1 FL=1